MKSVCIQRFASKGVNFNLNFNASITKLPSFKTNSASFTLPKGLVWSKELNFLGLERKGCSCLKTVCPR